MIKDIIMHKILNMENKLSNRNQTIFEEIKRLDN
jgi:hypothetical protein